MKPLGTEVVVGGIVVDVGAAVVEVDVPVDDVTVDGDELEVVPVAATFPVDEQATSTNRSAGHIRIRVRVMFIASETR